MKIKIHSSELNRMLKTVVQCIDTKIQTKNSNINIIHDNNLLAIRATNGTFSAVMTAPLMGGTGESFYVDGAMFAKVCAMCSGEIEISTDEKTCTVKGAGRTRIPIVNTDLPNFERVTGSTAIIEATKFTNCYNHVAYAIAQDQSRIQLTGVLTEITDNVVKMVALDGFQMSIEEADCEGDDMKAIIPGFFMKLVSSATFPGDKIKLTTDGHFIQVETDGALLKCGCLAGEYVDYSRILPTEFAIRCKANVSSLRDALKAGSVINNKQALVKLEVSSDAITIQNNSEQADYEANVPCETQGNGLRIAFNEKYLMNTINAIDTDDAELNFNNGVTPVVVKSMNGKGIRLVLPVRVQG